MSKDRTPPDIAAIRKARQRRHTQAGWALLVVWLAVFTTGVALNSTLLSWLAIALNMAAIAAVYGAHERALRQITGRPPADCNKIRKLEKRELPRREEKAG